MKKTLFLIISILFLAGLAMNIQYAVNDYGIKTHNLHNFVLADGTGSGTGGSGGSGSGTGGTLPEVIVSCCPDCLQSGVCWKMNDKYDPTKMEIKDRCIGGAPIYNSCNCSK